MIYFTSFPFFALNLVFAFFATNKIIRDRSHSKYTPRLDLLFILIWGYFPISFISAMTDMFFSKLIGNYGYCLLFSILKFMSSFSFIAPFALAIYFSLIMFTKLEIVTINKLGDFLILTSFGFIILSSYVLSIFFGAERTEKLENGCYKECSYIKVISWDKILFFKFVINLLVILFILIATGYEKYLEFKGRRRGLRRKLISLSIIKSFNLIVLVKFTLNLTTFIVNNINSFPKWVHFVMVDFERLKPFFYSLIILFCEKIPDLDLNYYSLRTIIKIPGFKKMLLFFFRGIKYERARELLGKFESASKLYERAQAENRDCGVMERNDRGLKSMDERLDVIERKIKKEGLRDFHPSNEFFFFFYNLQGTGKIELEIDSNRKKVSKRRVSK